MESNERNTEKRIVGNVERPASEGAYYFDLLLSDGSTMLVSIPKD